MKTSTIDRLLSSNLAHNYLFTEDMLNSEQHIVLVLNDFSHQLKTKGKKELIQIKSTILKDYKKNPAKAYFFIHVLKIVDEQLKKFGLK